MQIEAVLWDMDGVLVDSEKLVREAFIELMTEHQVMENPQDRYLETIGMNRKGLIDWYLQFVETEQEALHYCMTVGAMYKARMTTDLQLKPGVEFALRSVREQGIPQMVVTSSVHDMAISKLSLFNLQHYFDDVLGGDQVSHGKPHPEPYLTGAERLGVLPQHALVVEDSHNGVQAGLSAGCQVMHVPDLLHTHEDWQDKIVAQLTSLEGFPDWLERQRMG